MRRDPGETEKLCICLAGYELRFVFFLFSVFFWEKTTFEAGNIFSLVKSGMVLLLLKHNGFPSYFWCLFSLPSPVLDAVWYCFKLTCPSREGLVDSGELLFSRSFIQRICPQCLVLSPAAKDIWRWTWRGSESLYLLSVLCCRRVVILMDVNVLQTADQVGGTIGNPQPYNEGEYL